MELDVRLTRDQQLLVFHDRQLGRTSQGRSLVNHHSLGTLQRLDVGSWFSSEFAGEMPPTLDQVFESLPRDFLINVEMKVILRDMRLMAQRVAETIERHSRWHSTMVTSFNPVALFHLGSLVPGLPLGYIWSKRHPFPIRSRFLSPLVRPQWYNPAHNSYSQKLHRKFLLRGHRMLVWDTDFRGNLARMDEAGADAIVTDGLSATLEQKRRLFGEKT